MLSLSRFSQISNSLRNSAALPRIARNFSVLGSSNSVLAHHPFTSNTNVQYPTLFRNSRSFSVFANTKLNPSLPNVVILGTGGTIAGKGKSSTNTAVYQAGAMDVNDLISGTPEVLSVANCVAKGVLQKPSENMKVRDWITLAEKAQYYLDQDDVDGIVVTHGTDTLEESSFFCHLVLHSNKPVVFTGAMRPATAISADGGLNLLNAVVAAGAKETKGLGSLVVMNEELYSARDVTKINTFKVNSFGSGDVGPLGFVQEQHIYLYHVPSRKHTTECEFDLKVFESHIPKVDILYVYPNFDLDVLKYYLDHNDGLVIACSGNGSISDDMLPVLRDYNHKCTIVRGSRCCSGIVTPNPIDKKLHLVSSGNLSPQKSRVLLMMALTMTKDPERIQQIFNVYSPVCWIRGTNTALLLLLSELNVADARVQLDVLVLVRDRGRLVDALYPSHASLAPTRIDVVQLPGELLVHGGLLQQLVHRRNDHVRRALHVLLRRVAAHGQAQRADGVRQRAVDGAQHLADGDGVGGVAGGAGGGAQLAAHHGEQTRRQHALEGDAQRVGQVLVRVLLVHGGVGIHGAVHAHVHGTAVQEEVLQVQLELVHALHVLVQPLVLRLTSPIHAHDQLGSLAHAHAQNHVLRARTTVALLVRAVDDLLGTQRVLPDVQDAHTLRRVDLVARHRHVVHAQRLRVHTHLAACLTRVAVEEDAAVSLGRF